VLEPIDIEIGKVEMIPFIAEGFDGLPRDIVRKAGNAIDDGVTPAQWRKQSTGLDHAVVGIDGIDQLQRRFGDGFAEVVEKVRSHDDFP
jgi:hypothetical protein